MEYNFKNYEEYEIWQKKRKLIGFFVYFFILIFCLAFWASVFMCFTPKAHAEITGIPGKIEGYSINQWAHAIYKAENSLSHPYGIMVKYHHTSPRQACINTVRHQYRIWCKNDYGKPFIAFLASKYAPLKANNDPTGLNRNWAHNVSYFLGR